MSSRRDTATRILSFAFKAAVIAALVTWMLRAGHFDGAEIGRAFAHPGWLVAAGAILLLVFLAGVARWHFLLLAQAIHLPFVETLRLSLIGFFFSTVIPGGISGDLLKIYYVNKLVEKKKTGAALSILVDRILGLTVMMLVALASVAMLWEMVAPVAELRALAGFIALFSTGVLAALPIMLSTRVRHSRLVVAIIGRLPFSRILFNLYDAVHEHKARPRYFAAAAACSLVLTLLTGIFFFFLAQSLEMTALSITEYLFVIPLVFIVISVPIAPAGVGVGQAAALFIFSWFGKVPASFGVSLMTLYQMNLLVIAAAGALVYITYRRRMGGAPSTLEDVVADASAPLPGGEEPPGGTADMPASRMRI